MLCRDKCGYCTFAQPPARLDGARTSRPTTCSPSLARGARPVVTRRCSRWASARRSATRRPRRGSTTHGYASTVDYLVAMCELVLDETGLLPHANAGALFADELAKLRRSAPSQGMMIESLRADLDCHRGSPDKTPERRLATLEAAGELVDPVHHRDPRRHRRDRADRVAALVRSPRRTRGTATCKK